MLDVLFFLRKGAKAQRNRKKLKKSDLSFTCRDCCSLLCVCAPWREKCASLAMLLVLFLCATDAVGEETNFGPAVRDAAKIVGPDQCAKCHQPEVQQWMRTPHFATFDSLHRKPRAKEIANKLGVQSIKRSDL